jgi:hypothetical protein
VIVLPFEHHRQNWEDIRHTRSTPILLHNLWHSNLWCAETWFIVTDYQSESSTLKESWLSPTCFIPADHFCWKVLFIRFTLVVSTALIIQSDPCKCSLSVNSTDAWLESLPSLLEVYEPRDVYNPDETGLFFNVLPDRNLAYKGETCYGGKHSKDRLTVLLCVTSDGSDKQVLIVIGKSSKPRSFKDVKKVPIKYHKNSKAWMMTEIFCSFLHSLDTRMGAQNRQIMGLQGVCRKK